MNVREAVATVDEVDSWPDSPTWFGLLGHSTPLRGGSRWAPRRHPSLSPRARTPRVCASEFLIDRDLGFARQRQLHNRERPLDSKTPLDRAEWNGHRSSTQASCPSSILGAPDSPAVDSHLEAGEIVAWIGPDRRRDGSA